MDPLHRLAWHVLLQAIIDAPHEKYSAPAVLAGLFPWARIASLDLKALESTYLAARAGTLDLSAARVPNSDDQARRRLREMGAPMRKAWPGIKHEPERQQSGRKTWAENMRAGV